LEDDLLKDLTDQFNDYLPKDWTDWLKKRFNKKRLDDFLPLMKLENHLEEQKWMECCLPLKTIRKYQNESQFVIMALIPCQILFKVKRIK
jgi:hypothetical protein